MCENTIQLEWNDDFIFVDNVPSEHFEPCTHKSNSIYQVISNIFKKITSPISIGKKIMAYEQKSRSEEECYFEGDYSDDESDCELP